MKKLNNGGYYMSEEEFNLTMEAIKDLEAKVIDYSMFGGTKEIYIVTFYYQSDPELHGVFTSAEKANQYVEDVARITHGKNRPWVITKMMVDELPEDPVLI